MNYETIFNKCFAAVVEITGCEASMFFISKREDYVDARMLLVDWLIGNGFTEQEICRLTAMRQQRVNFLKNNATRRLNQRWPLRQAKKELWAEMEINQ